MPVPLKGMKENSEPNKVLARAMGTQVRSVQRFRNSVQPVVNLQWAEEWQGNPPHSPSLRGMTELQKRGKRYEIAFAEKVEELSTDGTSPLHRARIKVGQWLRFEDESGKSWAQPDVYALTSDSIWIFETKLTFVSTGVEQLEQRYGPLLAHLYPGLSQWRVVVCHDLAGGTRGLLPRAYRDLDSILSAPIADTYVWNWRGGLGARGR